MERVLFAIYLENVWNLARVGVVMLSKAVGGLENDDYRLHNGQRLERLEFY